MSSEQSQPCHHGHHDHEHDHHHHEHDHHHHEHGHGHHHGDHHDHHHHHHSNCADTDEHHHHDHHHHHHHGEEQEKHDHHHHHHHHGEEEEEEHPHHSCDCGDDHCGDGHGDEMSEAWEAFLSSRLPPIEVFKAMTPEAQEALFAGLFAEFQEEQEKEFAEMVAFGERVGQVLTQFRNAAIDKNDQFAQLYQLDFWLESILPETADLLGDINPSIGASIPAVAQHVYKLELFQPSFLTLLRQFLAFAVEWLDQQQLNITPPGVMNHFEVTLEYLGLRDVLIEFVNIVLTPLIAKQFSYIPVLLQQCSITDAVETSDCCANGGSCTDDHSATTPADKSQNKSETNDDTQQSETHDCQCGDDHHQHATDAPSSDLIFDKVHAFSTNSKIPSTHDDNSKFNIAQCLVHINLCLGIDEALSGGGFTLLGHRCALHLDQDTPPFVDLSEDDLGEDKTLPQIPGTAYIMAATMRHRDEPVTAGAHHNVHFWARSTKICEYTSNASLGPCLLCSVSEDDDHHEHEHNGACCGGH